MACILGSGLRLEGALFRDDRGRSPLAGARGGDAIIAQSFEAGGHRGMFLSDDLTTQVGTLPLVPQIVKAVKSPVIAAGGNAAVPAFPLATFALAPLRARVEGLGSGDFSPLWSGQNAGGYKEIPAAQLTRDLAAGLENPISFTRGGCP